MLKANGILKIVGSLKEFSDNERTWWVGVKAKWDWDAGVSWEGCFSTLSVTDSLIMCPSVVHVMRLNRWEQRLDITELVDGRPGESIAVGVSEFDGGRVAVQRSVWTKFLEAYKKSVFSFQSSSWTTRQPQAHRFSALFICFHCVTLKRFTLILMKCLSFVGIKLNSLRILTRSVYNE